VILTDFAFCLFAGIAVLAGWRVFRTDSMVRASFLLLVSFIAAAGIMLLLAAPYIGIATIFMMAVEMMAMALFMVAFMMNPAGLNPMMMVHQNRLSTGAALFAFAGLVTAVVMTDLPRHAVRRGAPVIHDLGIQLLGPSMLTFESAGVTLLAAMIAAVVLSARSGRFGLSDEGSRPPGLLPGGAPAGQVPDSEKDGVEIGSGENDKGKMDGGMANMNHEGAK
jgi:NADH-quinone oxidoreductase subunit J